MSESDVGLTEQLLEDIQHRGFCVSLLDMMVGDEMAGASQQIATVATMSGLLGGFASSVLMGVEHSEEIILGCLIATIICAMSSAIVASSMLLALWMDFTKHPQCSGANVTTRFAPLYLYAVGMFILACFSFVAFLLSFAYVNFEKSLVGATFGLTILSVVLCCFMALIGCCVTPGKRGRRSSVRQALIQDV